MKKVLIFSIIFFIICLSVNLISQAYSDKFISFHYKTEEIIYHNEEKIEKNFNKKVKMDNNAQIKIKNINFKLLDKNEEYCIIEINGEILENPKLQECEIENAKYKLKYSEEYSINTGNTYITFEAR